jgi:hypothetical protein
MHFLNRLLQANSGSVVHLSMLHDLVVEPGLENAKTPSGKPVSSYSDQSFAIGIERDLKDMFPEGKLNLSKLLCKSKRRKKTYIYAFCDFFLVYIYTRDCFVKTWQKNKYRKDDLRADYQ